MTDGREVVIARLGAQGDGIADGEGEPTFVPFALPGERWRLDGDAQIVERSPDRVEPICRHFTRCGGCTAQHMSAALYASWKTAILRQAFASRGIKPPLESMRRVEARSRRRAFFGVAAKGRQIVIGFREEGQHVLVDLDECPVLDPAIVAALPRLREMAGLLLKGDTSGRLTVTKLDAGLDVDFEVGRKVIGPELAAALAHHAEGAHLVRLSVDGDAIAMRSSPRLTLGGVGVEPPAGIFLQAVPEAERLMTELILAALPRKVKRIADLFCGVGTFTFALARHAEVLAVDGDKRAVECLAYAARHASGLKKVETRVRDLFREPLSRKELEGFDCVVFDPPRAGASAQAGMIAKSKVPVAIAVSCSAATLARDCRTLLDGGYRLSKVTPVDQFLFTPHVEAVAVLTR